MNTDKIKYILFATYRGEKRPLKQTNIYILHNRSLQAC